MTSRGWSVGLAGLICGLWVTAVWGSELVDRPGVGAKSYIETFDDAAAVDASAGLTPFLDESSVFNGGLEQISYLSTSITVPFDPFPGAYDYDDSKIVFENGEATLRPDTLWTSVLGTWRFEATAWDGTAGEVVDGAGGASGTIQGQAQTTPGQVGRAASFDGQGDAVVLGQGGGLALDPTQAFTLSAWFRTTGDGALIAKADSDFGARQFYLFVAGGRLWGAVGGSQHQGLSSGVSDGQWHHGVLVNRDVGGVMRFTLYVDGVEDGTFDSGTASNSADVLLGARRASGNTGLAFELNGELDEVAILDRALSSGEVLDLYAGGAGRALSPYPSDGPSITNNFGSRLFGVSDFRVFEATPSTGHAGQLGFQVSTDGEAWQVWSGSAWGVVLDDTSNDAATVEAHLSALDLTNGSYLYVRTFLLSDGTQPAGIDKLYWAADLDPVFEAREILGPIAAGQSFESLQAEITNAGGNYDLRLRLLEDDAATPVDEGSLPGNLNGFAPAELVAPGVDLSNLPGGSYYVEAIFENPLGRFGDSARLESFQVDYQESVGAAEGALTLEGGIEPVLDGSANLLVRVENASEEALVDVHVALDSAGLFLEWTAPPAWDCDAQGCTVDILLAGESVNLGLDLFPPIGLTDTYLATVQVNLNALNDADGSNNSAQRQLAFDPVVEPRLQIVHQAEPADGTNVTYDILEGPSLVLDDAVPDDGDGFGSQGEVVLEPNCSYTLDPSIPAGWLLDDVQCSAPTRSGVFQEAFSTDASVSYDPVAVAIEGGVARLQQDPLVAHRIAQWRFEEAVWNGIAGEVTDSGDGFLAGDALGDANTLAGGLLGRAATFDGQGDAVQLGQPSALDLDPSQPFTVSLWFRTLGNGALIAKADGNFNQRQFYLFVIDDRLWGTVGGSQHNGGTVGVSDGQWHHAALVNGGLGGPSTFTLYLDGQPDGTFSSGSATNNLDVLLGARRDQGNSGLAFQLDGELDEVTLLDRALTTEEIQSLYANGSGRLLGGFPSDSPSMDITLSPVDSGWTAFTGFEEELGLGNEGHVTYQLSTDGSTWQWFDGGSWSPAQANPSQSNDASTVDANMGALDYNAGQALRVRAFLGSDGSQPVELDRLRVLYTSDGLGGVSALNGASIDTTVSPDVTCQFSWITDPDRYGSFTLIQTVDPLDGTEFPYTMDFNGQRWNFSLQNQPGQTTRWLVPDWDPGLIEINALPVAGWNVDSLTCQDAEGSLFTTPYDLPTNYTFDPEAIEVTGGVARLRSDGLFDDLLGYWKMDEATWTTTPVADSSGQGLDASALGQAQTVSGLLGRAGSFGGQGDGVVIGQPPSLDLAPDSDDFSVSAWFRTTGDGALVGKAEDAFGGRQVYLFIAGGQVHANVGGVQNAGSGSFDDNQWHHVLLVNDTSGSAAEHRLYVDGVLRGTFNSGNATNGADWMIGARRQSGNVGTAFELDGEVDEVAIFGRALEVDEIGSLYQSGEGRSLGAFPSYGPSIVKTAGDSGLYLSPRGFNVLGDTDHVAFQLSTNGSIWQYWDGAAWQIATHSLQRNDAATVDAHIGQFETPSESIYVRAFLLSDGTEAVSLDEIQVEYDQLGSVGVEMNGDQASISVDLQGGQNVECSIHRVYQGIPVGSLRLELETTPASNLAFPTEVTFPDGSLDDNYLFDGFGYELTDLEAGTYGVISGMPPGWQRTSVSCMDSQAGNREFEIDYGAQEGFEFDPERIEMTGSLARLRADDLWPHLLAFWKLDAASWDGSSGEVLDASGNGHHGVAQGGADTVDGLLGRAGDFNGSTAYVSLGNPVELNLQPGSDAFTLSAWFRTTGDGAIIGKAGGTLGERQFYLFVLDDKLWSIVGGQVHTMTSTASVADGQWHHGALVNYPAPGGAMRHTLYLDGQPVGDFTSGSATNVADILIGARRADDAGAGLAFQLDGNVDEVMIFDRDLDGEEVASLYDGGSGRTLQAYSSDAPSIVQQDYLTGEVQTFLGHLEEVGPNHTGQVAYQIDLGDGLWRFWSGFNFAVASSEEQRSSLAELRQGLQTQDPLIARFRLKAFLISDGSEPVELDRVAFQYNFDPLVSFQWQGTSIQVDVEPGQHVVCLLRNELFSEEGSFTVQVQSEPADGTNYSMELGAQGITLDDEPIDTDGVGNSFSLPLQGGHTIQLQIFGHPRTGLRSIECTGNAVEEEHLPGDYNLFVPVQPGEHVVCQLNFEKWNQHAATYENLTLSPNSAIGTFAADRLGTRLMTMAADDFAGDNPDGFPEAFTYETATESWHRLTDNSQASTGRIDVSANGQWSVLPMRWDPNGFNIDNNGEIFRFDLVTGDAFQVTDTVGCDTFDPAISDDGNRVALATDCYGGDGLLDVVLMDGPSVVTLAPASGCESRFPKITADGSLVTFISNCDWLGLNPDQGDEIFQWSWQDGPLALEQWTHADGSVGAYISSHQVSDDGRYLAIMANNLLDEALDPPLFEGLVRRDRLTGQRLAFFPEYFVVSPFSGEFSQPYLPLAMDASGQHVAFYGMPFDITGDPVEDETPRWYWCEITEVGYQVCNEFAVGDSIPNAHLALLGRAHITWDGAGIPTIYLLSSLDFDGSNPDGTEEIWRVTFQ